jgi:hypothetical protein
MVFLMDSFFLDFRFEHSSTLFGRY